MEFWDSQVTFVFLGVISLGIQLLQFTGKEVYFWMESPEIWINSLQKGLESKPCWQAELLFGQNQYRSLHDSSA